MNNTYDREDFHSGAFTMRTNNPINMVQLTRTRHDGTVEGLISFMNEEPAWIPMRTIESMVEYIQTKGNK